MANAYLGQGVKNTPYTIYMKVPPILQITQNLLASKTFVQNSDQELSVTLLHESNVNIKWYRNGTKIAERNLAYTGKGPKGVTDSCPVNTATLGNFQYWCIVTNGYGESITSTTCAVTVKLNPPNVTTLTSSAECIIPGESFSFNYNVRSEDPYRLDVYMATETGSRVKMKSIDKPAAGANYTSESFTVSSAEIDALRPAGKERLNRYDFSVLVENSSGNDWSDTVTTYMGKDVPSIATLTWLRNEEVDNDTACAVFRLTTTDTMFGSVSSSGGVGSTVLENSPIAPSTIYNFSRVGNYSIKVNFPRDSNTHIVEVNVDGTLNIANTGTKYHRGGISASKSVSMAPKVPEPEALFTYELIESDVEVSFGLTNKKWDVRATAVNTGDFAIDSKRVVNGVDKGWVDGGVSRWVAGEVRTVFSTTPNFDESVTVHLKAHNLDNEFSSYKDFSFTQLPYRYGVGTAINYRHTAGDTFFYFELMVDSNFEVPDSDISWEITGPDGYLRTGTGNLPHAPVDGKQYKVVFQLNTTDPDGKVHSITEEWAYLINPPK